ncbi:hypothetical protein M5689_021980 [Euphorbia peplus]|nr:hypothetical protein M5689_021980 [Euphorbia peplus]
MEPLEPVIRWDLNRLGYDRDLNRLGYDRDLNRLGYDAYVILGSKLYFFARQDKSMRFYDMKTALSSPSIAATLLCEKSLQEGPPMQAVKERAIAVVIGVSKICVFGRFLYLHGRTCSRPSFELLDTSRLKWKSLPEPFKNYEEHVNVTIPNVTIESYCVHRSCLIIQTYRHGIYAINVDIPQPQWVTLQKSQKKKNGFPFQGMFAMVDEMMFNPCPYPITTIQYPFDTTKYPCRSRSRPFGALCFDHTCKNLCRVEAMYPSPPSGLDDTPCLLVDLLKFDHVPLDELTFDLSAWNHIQSDKYLTFALTSCHFDYLGSIAICPIKTSCIDESIEEEEKGEEEEKAVVKGGEEEDLSKKKKILAEKEGRRTRQMKNKKKFFQRHVVFLVKGPIYSVCISCTEEPYESLRGQLELFYGQMILILTESVNRCFEKNSKFDMTPLLGGTDVVFSSLIHSFSWNPATFLHAYTCLPLAYTTRQAAGAILQDVADSGVLFAILMCKHKVVSLVGAQEASLHPDDMLLLSNFIMSSESFRQVELTLFC